MSMAHNTEHTNRGHEIEDITVRTAGNDKVPFLEIVNSYTDKFFPDYQRKTYRVPAVYFLSEKLSSASEYQVNSSLDNATLHGEDAEMRFCNALELMKNFNSSEHEEPMVMISSFPFENYLCKLNDQIDAGRIAPPEEYSQSKEEGQHDVLLVHRKHGVIYFQVKAIGEYHQNDLTMERNKVKSARDKHYRRIRDYVSKGINQLEKDERFFKEVMKDLNLKLPVKKVIVLPNLTRTTLNKLEATTYILKHNDLFDNCICSDEIPSVSDVDNTQQLKLQNLRYWWEKNIHVNKEFEKDEDYKQVIGRYCGLLSMVEIPTTKQEQKRRGGKVEARTEAEAVAEMGYRNMRIILTPEQDAILNSDEKRLVIDGDFGTGKTILLILKAGQILNQGGRVCLASGIATCMSYYLYECVIAGMEDLKKEKVKIFKEESLENVFKYVKCTSSHLFYDELWIPLLGRENDTVCNVGRFLESIDTTLWFVKNCHYLNDAVHICFDGFKVVTCNEQLRCPKRIQDILVNGDISHFPIIDHSRHSNAVDVKYYECEECIREIHKKFASLGLKMPDTQESVNKCSSVQKSDSLHLKTTLKHKGTSASHSDDSVGICIANKTRDKETPCEVPSVAASLSNLSGQHQTAKDVPEAVACASTSSSLSNISQLDQVVGAVSGQELIRKDITFIDSDSSSSKDAFKQTLSPYGYPICGNVVDSGNQYNAKELEQDSFFRTPMFLDDTSESDHSVVSDTVHTSDKDVEFEQIPISATAEHKTACVSKSKEKEMPQLITWPPVSKHKATSPDDSNRYTSLEDIFSVTSIRSKSSHTPDNGFNPVEHTDTVETNSSPVAKHKKLRAVLKHKKSFIKKIRKTITNTLSGMTSSKHKGRSTSHTDDISTTNKKGNKETSCEASSIAASLISVRASTSSSLSNISQLDQVVGAVPGQRLSWSDVLFVDPECPSCVYPFKQIYGLPCEYPIRDASTDSDNQRKGQTTDVPGDLKDKDHVVGQKLDLPGEHPVPDDSTDSHSHDNKEEEAKFDKFEKNAFLGRENVALATSSAYPVMGIERKVVFCVVNDVSRPFLSREDLHKLRPFISRSTSHVLFLNCSKSPKDNPTK